MLVVRPDVPALVRIASSGDPPLSEASFGLLELGVALAKAAELCLGFLQRESFSMEIIESISPEDLRPMMKICVNKLQSKFICSRIEQFSWKKMKMEEDEASQQSLSRTVGGERIDFYKYNKPWECYKIIEKLL
jgi:hypothetical protein